MAKRGGKVHIAVTRRQYKGTEYTTTLLRHSYRQDGKVRNETVGNLSHLEDWMINGLRAMLAGRRLVDLDADLEIVRSLPHGHVEAVLGALRALDLERLISRTRSRERDLAVAMIVEQVLAPGAGVTNARRFGQTTLSEEMGLGDISERELLLAGDWLLARQPRIERTLARRHLGEEAFVRDDVRANDRDGSATPALASSRFQGADAHAFLCTLAFHLTWHLEQVWTPLIIAAADGSGSQIRELAQFSSYLSVLSELATRTRCTLRVGGSDATFEKLSSPTELQAHALALAAAAPLAAPPLAA